MLIIGWMMSNKEVIEKIIKKNPEGIGTLEIMVEVNLPPEIVLRAISKLKDEKKIGIKKSIERLNDGN